MGFSGLLAEASKGAERTGRGGRSNGSYQPTAFFRPCLVMST